MAAKAGKDFLLKIGDGGSPEVFTTIGGLRNTTMKLSNAAIDTTNVESGEYKEILASAGIKSLSISGTGIFTDGATLDQIRRDHISGVIRNFQIYMADTGNTWQGGFKIAAFERQGDYNKEQTYSITLDSSGAFTYT